MRAFLSLIVFAPLVGGALGFALFEADAPLPVLVLGVPLAGIYGAIGVHGATRRVARANRRTLRHAASMVGALALTAGLGAVCYALYITLWQGLFWGIVFLCLYAPLVLYSVGIWAWLRATGTETPVTPVHAF